MPEYEVDRPMALDTFLRRKDVQAWRIAVLIDCGAIKVFSEGRELPLKKGAKTHVDGGDKVRIEEPLSKRCQDALQQKVDSDWRDYAWVPGSSAFDKAMGKLIEARPQTIRITDPSIATLRQFLQMFERSPLVTHPVRSLIIASHANDEGQLKIAFDGGTGKFVDYEDLEAAVKSKGFVLKDEWFRPRPRDAQGRSITPYELLIRGCRIGTQRKFLEKLREALGRRIQVVAPKHFHVVDPHEQKPKGHIEYLAYSWSVHSPTPLKTQDAVVKALLGAGHTFIDASPIPEKKWKECVPRRPEAKYEQIEYTSVKSPVLRKAVKIPRKFRYRARKWLPRDEPLAMDKGKTTDAQRLEVLKPLLAQRSEFKSTHPYPLYERLGYDSFDAFIKGWTWTFLPKNKAADEVKFNALRHEYTVILPITELKSGELILNFYPLSHKDKVIERLQNDDTKLFATV